jgi:hypothetical protein
MDGFGILASAPKTRPLLCPNNPYRSRIVS